MKVRRWLHWYEAHHTDVAPEADIPLRTGVVAAMEVPGWRHVRRLRAVSQDGPYRTHFVLHEMQNPDALNAQQRETTRTTARTRPTEQHAWFPSSLRWTYSPTSTRSPHTEEALHA